MSPGAPAAGYSGTPLARKLGIDRFSAVGRVVELWTWADRHTEDGSLAGLELADIDDLGPGIDLMGEITDGTGFAIDSGEVYEFDYNTGTGVLLGVGGTWGSHALGGTLFDDDVARLYLLDIDAQLFEADPSDLSLSPVLVTGPVHELHVAGWSGLTGPLTECDSTLPPL